jgi:regulation of enolase protein 1 (concanavalin A-like superfamily)
MQHLPTSLLQPGFEWHCAPTSWTGDPVTGSLTICTTEKSDFWQRTHYGFRADTGHFLWTAAADDFVMEVEVAMSPLHQYDQAGLMVRLSPDCWLKTSVEHEDSERNRLGCVVTNRGYSDWSSEDVPAKVNEFALRVTRHAADYLVEARLPGGRWTQLRVTHLEEDSGSSAVRCGVYACSPSHPGFTAAFRGFSLCAR